MILPADLLFGIDDPAEWDAPGMIVFALGEHGAKSIFRRQNLDAEENRIGGVRALNFRCSNHVGDQVFGRAQADIDFR